MYFVLKMINTLNLKLSVPVTFYFVKGIAVLIKFVILSGMVHSVSS